MLVYECVFALIERMKLFGFVSSRCWLEEEKERKRSWYFNLKCWNCHKPAVGRTYN